MILNFLKKIFKFWTKLENISKLLFNIRVIKSVKKTKKQKTKKDGGFNKIVIISSPSLYLYTQDISSWEKNL